MDGNLSSPAEPAVLAGQLERALRMQDAGGLMRSLSVVSAPTVYLETSDSDSKSNTEASVQGSTDTQPTVTSQTHGNSNEGFSAIDTTGVTLPLRDLSVVGTFPQTTATSQSDWVSVTSLPIQYTAVEGVSHTSLRVTNLSLSNESTDVCCETTPPELLPTAGDDGDSQELAGPSQAEILAMAIGSFTVTALMGSLSYQLVVFIRRKKMLKRSCSVYIIENEMHKCGLGASDLEPETQL